MSKTYIGKLKIKGVRKGAHISRSRESLQNRKMHTLYRKVDKDGCHWAVVKRGSSIISETPIKAIPISDSTLSNDEKMRKLGYVKDSDGSWIQGDKDSKPKKEKKKVIITTNRRL